MQTQDTIETCYRRGNRKTWRKTSPQPSKSKLIHQRINLEYTNNKDPPSLVYPMYLSPPSFCYQLASRNLVFSNFPGSRNSAQLHPPSEWLLPMLPNSTKTSLYTQIGCGKCLNYQPLRDLDMERQEVKKNHKEMCR